MSVCVTESRAVRSERSICCSKCGRRMQAGFIVDRSYGNCFQEEWVAGPVRRSRLFGVILRRAIRRKVTAYRCGTCGYLEFFAPERVCRQCGCALSGSAEAPCPTCGKGMTGDPLSKASPLSLQDAMLRADTFRRFWGLAQLFRLLLAWLPGGMWM